MFIVTEQIQIPETEFSWTYVRSSGPGGQNVNKVASKAVLRWNLTASLSIPEPVKARFRGRHARRLTAEGDFLLTSQRYRDQERNRQDCLEKLAAFLREAIEPPKPRRPSKPTRGSKERRLTEKKRRSSVKANRKSTDND